MINYLKKAAVSAFTLVAVLGMPANAALNYEEIARKLHSIGVTTQVGVCNSNPDVLGQYSSGRNHLCISQRITDPGIQEETVLHELVHVIQDCIGDGIQSPRMGSIAYYLHGGEVNEAQSLHRYMAGQVNNRYSRSHIADHITSLGADAWVELEAYALEDQPKVVLSLLDRCQ